MSAIAPKADIRSALGMWANSGHARDLPVDWQPSASTRSAGRSFGHKAAHRLRD